MLALLAGVIAFEILSAGMGNICVFSIYGKPYNKDLQQHNTLYSQASWEYPG